MPNQLEKNSLSGKKKKGQIRGKKREPGQDPMRWNIDFGRILAKAITFRGDRPRKSAI